LELESAMIVAFDPHYITADQARPIGEAIRAVIKPINGLLRASTAGFPKKKFPVNR
jgi:hypothetical protein